MPKDLREQVESAYSMPNGQLSMQPFFDLLAIHELGHAFHIQGGLTMQRKWMGELFSNIFLHTFIAENEPGLLPALTVFPRMVVANGSNGFKYTTLADVQEHYNEIGQHHPKNYGWFQCRWHAAAARIYDAEGAHACSQLWLSLHDKKEILTDTDLINYLETSVGKSIADMIRNWDSETGK